MLPYLESISEISRIIHTNGSMPVVVMADDYEDYACKYDSNNKLINEYLAHQFLQAWEIEVFSAAFVTIKRDHIPQRFLNSRIRLTFFDKPTFGLKYNNNAIEVTNIFLGLKNDPYEIKKFHTRFNLLKIALFDLWLANDDRNHNNYNILIRDTEFIPIDHSNIFDGGRLGGELAQLTYDDSILNSDLALTFLNSRAKIQVMTDELMVTFPIFVQKCGDMLPTLIEKLPEEWCNDKPSLSNKIMSSVIDNDNWIHQTNSTFLELVHNIIR